jgi:hypothetical protein
MASIPSKVSINRSGGSVGRNIGMSVVQTGLNMVPVVGGVLSSVAGLFAHIGKGCGDACIEGSKLEQVFELSVHYIVDAAAGGVITASEANWLRGTLNDMMHTSMQQLGTKQAQAGEVNAQKLFDAVNAQMQGWLARGVLSTFSVGFDRAHDFYSIKKGTAGWYPESIDSAWDLTDGLLQQLPRAQVATTIQPVSTTPVGGPGIGTGGTPSILSAGLFSAAGPTWMGIALGLGLILLIGFAKLRR